MYIELNLTNLIEPRQSGCKWDARDLLQGPQQSVLPSVTPVPSTVFPMVGPVLEFTVGRSAGPSLISLVVSVDVKHSVY